MSWFHDDMDLERTLPVCEQVRFPRWNPKPTLPPIPWELFGLLEAGFPLDFLCELDMISHDAERASTLPWNRETRPVEHPRGTPR